MPSLKELEAEVRKINSRNRRVEDDKAWETSLARRGLIAVFTYLAISVYLFYIGIENAWLHAIVPAIAFLLSTFSLPFFKKLWIRHFYGSKKQTRCKN